MNLLRAFGVCLIASALYYRLRDEAKAVRRSLMLLRWEGDAAKIGEFDVRYRLVIGMASIRQ